MTWTIAEYDDLPLPDWLKKVPEAPGGDHPRFVTRGPPDVWVFAYDTSGNLPFFPQMQYSVWIDGIPCDGDWDAIFIIETVDADLAREAYKKALDLLEDHGCKMPEGLLGHGNLYDGDGFPTAGFSPGSGLQPLQGASPDRGDVIGALGAINRHRRRAGQPDLDPKAAGWSDDDVLVEAERIAALNPGDYEKLKRRLMR